MSRREPLDPIDLLRLRLADPGITPRRLANAAGALFEVRDSAAAVPLLLGLLQHAAPTVRREACRALSAHPYPEAIYGLAHLAEHDPYPTVRAAAEKALEMIEALPLPCIQCGGEWAELAPEPDSNPEGEQIPRPMFCDRECAADYALSTARDEFHPCLTAGWWEPGPAADCAVCTAAAKVGAPPTPPTPNPLSLVTDPGVEPAVSSEETP